jgi:hypothetical protein
LSIPVLPADSAYVTLGAAAVALIAIVCAGISLAKASKLQRELARLHGVSVPARLDERLAEHAALVARMQREVKDVQGTCSELARRLQGSLRHFGMIRYNAFADTGANLSFSLALLSDEGDGFVLTSLYGREETRVYAKPVERGASSYALSEEERQAISMAWGRAR